MVSVVQVHLPLPRRCERRNVRTDIFYFIKKSVLKRSAAPPYSARSRRSARLFACKRAHNGSLSLWAPCGLYAPSARFSQGSFRHFLFHKKCQCSNAPLSLLIPPEAVARLTCSLASALTTVRCRFGLRAGFSRLRREYHRIRAGIFHSEKSQDSQTPLSLLCREKPSLRIG